MEKKEANTSSEPRRRRPVWVRICKWLAIAALTVVSLVILVCSLIVWILTPGRLTPLVADVASDYLRADVSVSRVELTFWKTFPEMTLEVDSLCVVSRSLDVLPDSVSRMLPANADSLLTLASFSGGVNVAKLLAGELALYNVDFRSPRVNLLQVNDSVANYLVLPSSEEEADTVSPGGFMFRRISINRFLITDAEPLRFRSLPDSLDVAVGIRELSFDGASRPRYAFTTGGTFDTPLLRDFDFGNLSFGVDGEILWDSRHPYDIGIEKFVVGLDSFTLAMNADMNFGNGLRLKSFTAESNLWSVDSICSHLPDRMRQFVRPLRTDMAFSFKVALKQPWAVADTVPPSFAAELTIPQCAVDYQNLHFRKFSVDLAADYDGADPDASVIDLHRLFIDGRTIDVDLRMKLTHIFSDVAAEGKFRGAVAIGNFPPKLRGLLPVSIGGRVSGNADFRVRKSDFTRENFHRAHLSGSLQLNDIEVLTPDTARAYVHHAELRFGSNTAFVNDSRQRVDSLLTLSLMADTLSLHAEGTDVEARGVRMGGGTLNRRASSDTTEINPFGLRMALERLKFDSTADTLRLRLRDASVSGSLRRYKGEARLPQMNLRIDLGALHFGQALTRLAMRKAGVDVSLRMRQRRNAALTPEQRLARRRHVNDSLAALGIDTVANTILDEDNRRMFMRWDFSGDVKAESGRLITPAFPLRNSIRNINLHFNQDSIQLTDLHVRAGQSDFTVNGTVSNLRRALVGRRNNTLGVRLSLRSDTINVNEIVRALFAGGSLTQQADSAMVWNEGEEGAPDASDNMAQMADTASTGPLLIPRNLDARFFMRAAHVLYSDLVLHSFKGALMVYDGAVNLRDLSASTDVGSIRVDGLYSAPSASDLRFGMGMKVDRFRLDRLTSIVPAIDSLLPAIRGFSGIVNADVAVTTDLDPDMNIDIPTLRAAVKIEGDSLVLLDADTFKTLSKWLFFKNKKRNLIDHMAVEAVIENSAVELYPFMFDIDRYRLGVMGSNDMAMNLNYHVSVLKSPMPFKFGINIKGTPENMKIRLGGAKFKENMVVERQSIADNTRVNIVQQIDNVFRRGITKARMGRLQFNPAKGADRITPGQLPAALDDETLSHLDSLRFIRQGLIDNPDTLRYPLRDSLPTPSIAPSSLRKSRRK